MKLCPKPVSLNRQKQNKKPEDPLWLFFYKGLAISAGSLEISVLVLLDVDRDSLAVAIL